MTTAYISVEHITDYHQRQDILRIIRTTYPYHTWTWGKYMPEGSFTRQIIGVTLNEDDAIMFKLKYKI